MTLAPGFHPQTLSGVAGGPQNASTHTALDGVACPGWIPATANHQINLTATIPVTIEIESTIDTTLAIWGPDGWRCNDDTNGYNPAISDALGLGTYSIFVGSYSAGTSAPYTLLLGEGVALTAAEAGSSGDPAGFNTAAATANFDAIALSTGFLPDPQTLRGTAGGDSDAAILGETVTGSCVGWASSTPDHIMTLGTGFEFLRVSISAAQDTTLAIFGPQGWHCNDDTSGYNPEIAMTGWTPGVYRIWVGTFDQGVYWPYEISFSEYRGTPSGPPLSAVALDVHSTTPNYGALTVSSHGGPTAPHVLNGVSGGAIDSNVVLDAWGAPCSGWVSANPDHLLEVIGYHDYLRLSVRSGGDTTLVVNGPSGFFCNDDAETLDAGIARDWAPGTYRVWVGSYNSGQNLTYELEVSRAPTVEIPAIELTFEGSFEWVDVFFSGPDAETIFDACSTYVSSAGTSMVDDVMIFGTLHHNGPSYWDNRALCSMAAANARPRVGDCPVRISGQVEDVPFDFCGVSVVAVREAISTYVPMLAMGGMIDDITIDGVPHHNGPSYWDTDEVTAMILSSVIDRSATVIARGSIEDSPFVFTGYDAADIRAQCETYVGEMNISMVDDITVNGETRHNGPSYWNTAEICMIISSLAR